MTSSHPSPVVVGFDESAGARDAVQWAAREALARDRRLHVVRVFETQWSVGVTPASLTEYPSEFDHEALRQVLAAQLESEVEQLRRDHPTLEITSELLDGLAADALAATAGDLDAELVVVGGSGHGAVARTLLGSTAAELVHFTSRPVVVVRGEVTPPAGRATSVVIGVGGLGTGSQAARFALDFAARHKLPVRAVHGRSDSPFALITERLTAEQRNAAASQQEIANAAVAAEVDAWRDGHPDLDIQREEVEEQPVQALLDRAGDAALLVVGSRHRGALQRVFLGSISHAVLHHATCPVAVIREPDEEHQADQA